jgi:O-antigen/teichoic acid export membrane protein
VRRTRNLVLTDGNTKRINKSVGVYAALDQGWLSALNFCLSIAFIRLGGKTEYATYLLIFGGILLWQGVHNAVLASPFSTIYARRSSEERDSAAAFFVSGTIVLAGVSALLVFFWMIFVLPWDFDPNIYLAFAAALGVSGALCRDTVRLTSYANLNSRRAFLSGVLYGVTVLVGVAPLIFFGWFDAANVNLVAGISGILVFFLFLRGNGKTIRRLAERERKEFWSLGRWGLIGATVTWINLNTYPYIAMVHYGPESTADIGAARQLLMPLVLLFAVWSAIFRPRIGRWAASNQYRRIIKISLQSICVGVALFGLLVAACVVAFPVINEILGGDFDGLLPLIYGWSLVMILSMIRTILMATLMISESGYKFLSRSSVYSLLVYLIVVSVAKELPPVWLVVALAAVELFQTALIGINVYRLWGRWHDSGKSSDLLPGG